MRSHRTALPNLHQAIVLITFLLGGIVQAQIHTARQDVMEAERARPSFITQRASRGLSPSVQPNKTNPADAIMTREHGRMFDGGLSGLFEDVPV